MSLPNAAHISTGKSKPNDYTTKRFRIYRLGGISPSLVVTASELEHKMHNILNLQSVYVKDVMLENIPNLIYPGPFAELIHSGRCSVFARAWAWSTHW